MTSRVLEERAELLTEEVDEQAETSKGRSMEDENDSDVVKLKATTESDNEEENEVDDVTQPSTSSGIPLLNCRKHTRREEVTQPIHEEAEECEGEEKDDEDDKNACNVSLMITITFLFFLVELFVGIMNKSIALLADSYHMLSDVMALFIAFICLRISQRKSKKNGFGWVRAEVLGALVNGVFLLAMCFTIALEAFGRIVHPRAMSHPLQVLIVGVIGFIINIVGIGLFHGSHGHSHAGGGHGHSHGGGGGHSHGSGKKKEKGHGHSHANGHCKEESPSTSRHSSEESDPPLRIRPDRSMSHISNDVSHNHLALRLIGIDNTEDEDSVSEEETQRRGEKQKDHEDAENLNMRGVLLHIIADAIGSVFVILTAAASYWFSDSLGVVNEYLDPVLSLGLVLLICFSAYSLVAQTADIIMRRSPAFLDVAGLKGDMRKISGVIQVVELSAWTLVANRHIAAAHVEFCSVVSYDEAVPKIRRLFHRNNIHSLTIQPSFSSTCILEEVEVPESDSGTVE